MFWIVVFGINYFLGGDKHENNPQDVGKIVVEIKDIHQKQGTLYLLLFNQAKGFPFDNTLAYRTLVIEPDSANVHAEFITVPYGKYAVTAWQDHNVNQKLDRGFLNYPLEGIGYTLKICRWWLPSYRKSSFNLERSSKAVLLRMNY